MNVAKTMDARISLLASNTTGMSGRRSSGGRAAFSRNLRTTFSTSMIASSTRAPIAMAIPPSVIVLIDAPSSFITKMEVINESGMATIVITVARRLARKRRTMSTTSRAPSPSAETTLSMATWMKSACRKMWRWISMPAGKAD